MKKRYKLLAVFVVVVLVVCCCCIPVSAASFNVGIATQVFAGFDVKYTIINGYRNPNGSYWINYYAGRTDDFLGLIFPIDLVINRGDTVEWTSFFTDFYFSLDYTTTVSLSLGFLDEYYTFYSLEDRVYSDNLTGSFQSQFFGGSKQFTEELNVKYICIMLYGYYNQTEGGTFAWQPYTFNLYSTSSTSILLEGMISEQQKTNEKLDDLNSKQDETNELLGDITADKYTPPSGQDQMGELTEKEEAVNQSAQQGMDEAGNMFKAFSLDFFTDGLGAVVQIYNRIIPKIPWLNQLITISLALGLFSFLVGAAQAYIGRLNANDRKAQREQARRRK